MSISVTAAKVAAIVCFLSAISLGASPVLSQDADQDNWSGLSLSVGVGGRNFDPNLNADLSRQDFGCLFFCFFNADNNQDAQANLSDDDWEAFGTAQIAYDQKISNFVVGVFADIDFGQDHENSFTLNGTDEKNCRGLFIFPINCPIPPNGVVGGVETETGTSWSVGGRLGYLVSPTWLVYGLVAYSETDMKISASIKDPFARNIAFAGDQPTSASFKTELTGITYGGGTEFEIAKNLHLKLEYRYTDYDSESFSHSNMGAVGNILNFQLTEENVGLNLDSEVHSVRAAIVLKLGTP